jgi:hypothetical protein
MTSCAVVGGGGGGVWAACPVGFGYALFCTRFSGRWIAACTRACMQVPGRSVTLEAHLRRSQLVARRTYAPDPAGRPVVVVTERLENLQGVERAMGRSQHVSIGHAMLSQSSSGTGGCRFACNADRGMTWPDADPLQTFQHATLFDYPDVPAKKEAAASPVAGGAAGGDSEEPGAAAAGTALDWRKFPRSAEPNSDLLTLRVDPAETFGWFVAERDVDDSHGCAWVRARVRARACVCVRLCVRARACAVSTMSGC